MAEREREREREREKEREGGMKKQQGVFQEHEKEEGMEDGIKR